MDNDLKEVAEHLQENGSDILSIKLLVDRTKLKEAKEHRQQMSHQTNFYLLILVIWTMILIYYFYQKEKKQNVEFAQAIAVYDSTSTYMIDSLQNYVDSEVNITFDSIKEENHGN
jgi:hypothetical protein